MSHDFPKGKIKETVQIVWVKNVWLYLSSFSFRISHVFWRTYSKKMSVKPITCNKKTILKEQFYETSTKVGICYRWIKFPLHISHRFFLILLTGKSNNVVKRFSL